MRPLLYPTCNYSKTARHEKGPRVLYCEKRKAARVDRRRAENPPACNAVGSGSA